MVAKERPRALNRSEYYGLQKYLTTFSSINRINVNSASVPVLVAVPGLSDEAADLIYGMRQEAPFLNITEVMEKDPGDSY